MLQKMAGFWRAAQSMYWRGPPQKVTGAMIVGGSDAIFRRQEDASIGNDDVQWW